MTVPSATNRVNYTGNGVTTAFSFPYIFYDEDHLKVYIDSVLQTSGYTITGAGVDAGGTVTFTSPPAVDEAILIRRVVGYVQDTDFENFDGNPSDVTEKQFDLLAMQTQQLADESARSLKLREDDPTTSIELPLVADRANMFLAFDSAGNPTASSGATSSGTTFGATGEDLAATATPALARAVLEIGTGTMATQAASAVAITGGTITGITDLAIADGGTGGSTAAAAFANLAGTYFTDRVIRGLTLSNGTDATNDIDIAAGTCVSDDGTTVMTLSAITKQLDAAWAVGSAAGGLDTGSIADTTYHVWVIHRTDTGVTDALFSASASAPTMPANYTKKKCIGSIIRSGGTILAFFQDRNRFYLSTPIVTGTATNPGTSAVTRATGVPLGVKFIAMLQVCQFPSTTAMGIYASSLDSADVAPQAPATSSLTAPGMGNDANGGGFWQFNYNEIRTNTSGEIRTRVANSGAADRVGLLTLGWIDPRI